MDVNDLVTSSTGTNDTGSSTHKKKDRKVTFVDKNCEFLLTSISHLKAVTKYKK